MIEPTPNRMRRVAIIGGGISGLAAAHRLHERSEQEKRPIEIVLLEAGSRLGGVVRTTRRDGFLLEAGPDSFISEKPEALALAQRIGLAPRLIETNNEHRRSFIVRGGRLLPVPEGFQLLAPSKFWPFVTSPIFSWMGKARLALDLFLPRRSQLLNGDDDESLAEFVGRRLGREALERMAQPMVGGIYTADPELLSLRATMPRFQEMERLHRSLIRAMWHARRKQSRKEKEGTSGARYSLFLSFDDGMQTLSDALAARLPPQAIKLNRRIASLSFDGDMRRWLIRDEAGETFNAEAICLALPAYASAALLSEHDARLAAELNAIPYASTATVNLAYRRADIKHALDGFGFVVPFVERKTILACTFASVKFAGRAPEGQALLRAFVGGALQPENFALDEQAMTKAVQRDLRELLGIKQPPLLSHVEKWPRSMAQYHVGHLDRIARIGERLDDSPNLRLCGNAYAGAGIPDCIRSGERAADEILEYLSESTKSAASGGALRPACMSADRREQTTRANPDTL